MSSTAWVDAVRASHGRTKPVRGRVVAPVPVSTWLGAVLLDDAGWGVENALSGTSLILAGDRQIADAVAAAVMEALRGHASLPALWSAHSPDPDGGVLVIGRAAAPASAAEYDAAVDVGAPVVLVTDDVSDVRPESAVALADRVLSIADACRPGVLEALTTVVCGEAVAMAARHVARLSTADLLRCVPLGSTAADCRGRIRRLSDTMDASDATDRAKPAAPAAPAPTASAQGDVVRRLSEMTGFGEAAAWGRNLARDLRDYRAGRLVWRDVDRGVLLSGPPGCGKTTFARALALECEVELVVTTYSEWATAGGGTGDSMSKGLTKLFETWRAKAKERGAVILLVDEIDSMGVRGGAAHNESWYAPIVNAWLAFLDGAVVRDGIVVVGATNHPERVDPAMLRPGRLDRHLELPMPDVAALAGVVRLHLGDDAVIDPSELAEAARAVRGRSPAEISLLAREARRVARWCQRRVCAGDLVDVLRARRLASGVSAWMEHDTAVHEAAHAVASVVLGVDPLVGVDLDRCTTATLQRRYWTRAEAEHRLTSVLAARAAEEVILGATTSGAQQDLLDATTLATSMHASHGWGAAGLVAVPTDAALDDPEVRRAVRGTLDEAYGRALDLVREHRAAIGRVADALVERRYLDGAEVRAAMDGASPAPAPRPARDPRVRVIGDPRRIPPGI